MLQNIILILFVFFIGGNISFAEENDYILQYARCNELLGSPYIADILAWEDTKCLLLSQEGKNEVILLSEDKNILGSSDISQELQEMLKQKYYRGEKLEVTIHDSFKEISHPHIFVQERETEALKLKTLAPGYSISFGEDMSFSEKKILSQYCQADSFLLSCKEGFYKDIQSKIDTTFKDIFLRGEKLFQKDIPSLQNEKEKIQKIRALYGTLSKEYQNSEKILYLLQSIDYKLSIYQSIIENTIQEKEIGENISIEKTKIKGAYYTTLGDDIFVFTEKLYVYFYIGNTLVNTIQNDLSHFTPEEIQKYGLSLEDRSLLAYHLIEKYNLIQEKTLPKNMRLLEKKWLSGVSYILISSDGRRYALEYCPKEIQVSGNDLIFMTERKNNTQKLLKTSGKANINELYTLESGYTEIVSFSLSGKTIEANLKKSDGTFEKKYISY